MPRRLPPTPLRLVSGPLPSRGRPKHTLPSLPRPIFHPSAQITRGPTPRARALPSEIDEIRPRVTHGQFPPLILPIERASRSGESSPTSAGSWSSGKRSRSSSRSRSTSPERVLRGPWDHSSSIHVPFDVEAVLAPPRPVAINPTPVWL
ncbi:hypothetical protein SCP_0409040 [Sparassis crispa]|uniref:Uncharacterized protein n=1 Tax=Sparassis crispa TaxID=139825 RepID=A0A401GK35_9APHY|nr:hypothetical protein SCP_0409040 [Sparassis crispa]GBE82520.1 hypothetical protein SCP_0409040 [Sparassis crispa]